jgi:hypothetical protein
MHYQPEYSKDKLKRWLLTITMFLSFFQFSGCLGHTAFQQAKAVQTEWVLPFRYDVTARTISYKKAIASCCPRSFHNSILNRYSTEVLVAYNNLIRVKLNKLSKESLHIKPANRFLQVKTTPRSSIDDKTFSVRG